MLKPQHILLASHGTRGSMAAVNSALQIAGQDTQIHHLVVVPGLWQGMTGDDWLNNGSTRDTYRRYLESELGKEIDSHCDLVQQQAEEKGISCQRTIMVGNPEQCLLEFSRQHDFDLVVMGSPRPKGEPGLRSRMKLEPLVKGLAVPLLIIPFPGNQADD